MVGLPKCINLKNYKQVDVNEILTNATEENIGEAEKLITCHENKVAPDEFKSIKDFNHISFGHFIMLEKIITAGLDEQIMLQQIMPLVLRPATEDLLDNEDLEKEKEHTKKILDLPIGVIMNEFLTYSKLRVKYVFNDYNGVIYATIDKDKKDEPEEDEDETSSNSGDTAREDYNKRFFWYNLIGTVANDDIFKRPTAINLPMYEVMPFLAEKRYKEIIERLERR